MTKHVIFAKISSFHSPQAAGPDLKNDLVQRHDSARRKSYSSAMEKRRKSATPARPKRKTAPYPFVLEALMPLDPVVRPMFSGFAVYIGEKIVLMLRDSLKNPKDNGVWLVFSESAHLADKSISRDFPSIRNIELLGGKIAHWRLIPADSPAFESEALHACDLVLKRDPRFGRVPQSRKAKPAKQRV